VRGSEFLCWATTVIQLLTIFSYRNEDEVGAGVRKFLSKNPNVKREDIFITTKVWPHLLEPGDLEWSLNDSREMLGLDYVDCFLIHWPFAVERTADKKVKLGPDGGVRVSEHL
jgi:diketogulonate reductase-like aldo/keto reductase